MVGIPREIRAVAGGEVVHLRVAFTGLAMATVLPRILREFHKRHPGIRLELNESPTAAQLNALRAGELACGFFHPEDKPPPDLSKYLLSPMPGLLKALAVKEGQEVKSGETLAIVEAMKMENVLKAERDATIKRVAEKAGASLAVDQIIIEFA